MSYFVGDMMKYEGVAAVGDRIRAYDFLDSPDCVEGVVERITDERGYRAFAIRADKCSWDARVGQLVYVPMEIALMEWEGRVVKL